MSGQVLGYAVLQSISNKHQVTAFEKTLIVLSEKKCRSNHFPLNKENANVLTVYLTKRI